MGKNAQKDSGKNGLTVYKDYDGREIHLTESRWRHIVVGHPEMKEWRSYFEFTLSSPALVVQDEQVETTTYYFYLLPCKLYLMVVVDWSEAPAMVKTAFRVKRPKEGKILHVTKPSRLV